MTNPIVTHDARPSRGSSATRLNSLDALRGGVMILMALDHVRDFFNADAMSFSPTNLARTNVILFFTRWITHFCLPVFVFAAGAGAYLWWRQRERTKAELSHFLWTRGIWFIALELTVMQLAYNFNFSTRFPILLLILWIFGICMLLMAALIRLPWSWLLGGSLSVIALHNCLDALRASQFGSWAWLWNIVHQPGIINAAGRPMLVTYTLIPWVAVMVAGFCFGRIFEQEPAVRQKLMRRMGFVAVLAFLALRTANVYGDPAAWSFQKSSAMTVVSFLNCTKYPASLDFLLMTLGPALMTLAYLDRRPPGANNPLVIFGRVPLFYFVLHFYLIHALEAIFAWVRYGNAALSFLFSPPPSMGTRQIYPADFGYGLWVTYVMWALVVACLYPLCRWYANVRASGQHWWLRYL